jgi:hypothetical protein
MCEHRAKPQSQGEQDEFRMVGKFAHLQRGTSATGSH